MSLTLELILILATLPLIWHAIRSYSTEQAILFWVGGLFFGLWREIAMTQISGLYVTDGFHLTLFSIPLISLILWSNLSYISWQWVNNLQGRDYLEAHRWDQHQPLLFITMVALAFVLETGFRQFEMSRWIIDSPKSLWGGTPLLAPFAYGFSGSLYLMGYKSLIQRSRPIWTSVSQSLLVQAFLIIILMGLMLIMNTLIILIFS